MAIDGAGHDFKEPDAIGQDASAAVSWSAISSAASRPGLWERVAGRPSREVIK